MFGGDRRWLLAIFGAIALLHAAYFFAHTFASLVHSDVSILVLLGQKAALARSPVVTDWYYANGDTWFLGPHLVAAFVTLVFGVNLRSLEISVALVMAVDAVVLYACLRELTRSRVDAAIGTIAMLAAWSRLHLLFGWVEEIIGFNSATYLVLFVLAALSIGDTKAGVRAHAKPAFAGVTLAAATLQNPSRALLFGVAPLALACLVPWIGVPLRRRLRIGAWLTGAFLLAVVVYRLVLLRHLSFSPNGGVRFALGDLDQIRKNVAVLSHAVYATVLLRDDVVASALLGGVVLAFAVFTVAREILRSRALEPLRFVAVCVSLQIAIVFVPLVVGNLVADDASARYFVPSVAIVIGLACLIAGERIAARRPSKYAAIWMWLLPLAAGVAASRRMSGPREVFSAADPIVQQSVADELVRRGLPHGFATYWNANVITVLSRNTVKTCSVFFEPHIVPCKWIVDRACFDASTLPPKFFVLVRADEREGAERAIAATLPPPTERFAIGDTYEVLVFDTKDASLAWLEEPKR